MAASKRRRRIVASSSLASLDDASEQDLSDAIDQALGTNTELDEIVQKHSGPSVSLTVPHGMGDVPPEDDDPSIRDGATLHVEAEIPDLSDEKIRSLDDLMARFPFDGTGIYYVRVVRKKPHTWRGHACAGLMRPITSTTTEQEFTEIYGGGEYSLVVYGPPRKGGLTDPSTGRKKPKALAPEITLSVPWDADGLFGTPPNPDAAMPSEEAMMASEGLTMRFVEDAMSDQPARPFLRRPATPADAAIHRTNVEADLQSRNAAAIASAEEAKAHASVERLRVEKEASAQERALDILREQATKNAPTDVAAIISALSGIIKPPSDDRTSILLDNARQETARMAKAHQEELTRIADERERERTRLIEIHQADFERRERAHNEELRILRKESSDERDARERAVRELEDRHQREMDRMVADHRQLLESMRAEERRRQEDIERQMRLQLETEKASHERELRSVQNTSEGMRTTEKSVLEERLRVMAEEKARLLAEVTALKQELADKADLPTQIQKFETVAESLGFSKGGDSTDAPAATWKDQMAGIAKELAPQLPHIMRAAGDMFAKTRPAPAAVPTQPAANNHRALPAAAAPPPMTQPMYFATEGIEPAHPRVTAAPLPVTASMYPPVMPEPVAQQAHAVPSVLDPNISAATNVPPVANMQPATPVERQSQSVAPPPPQVATTSVAPPSEMESQVLAIRENLEEALANGHKAEKFASDLKDRFGAEAVREISKQISAPQIIAILRRHAPDSPLVKMRGREWLTALDKALKTV